MNTNPLKKLGTFGQSIWLDYIRRDLIASGQLQRLIDEDGLRGMTSNPSIFEKAIVDSHEYDEDIRTMALEGKGVIPIYEALSRRDVQRAADEFRPLYDKTDGHDGYVSLEVNPHLAHDAKGTIEERRRLWGMLSRPNVFIKVPATTEGLSAIQQLISDGINVNVTLLFGLPRYRQVADAYLAGLAARLAHGKSVNHVASVASFFVSRIDTLMDPLLAKVIAQGGEKADLAKPLRGHVAIASAKIAYQIYKEIVGSDRVKTLADQGARVQRLLWASTSTKNPDDSDIKYMEALIGPDTVNTAPLTTLDAYRDHGDPKARLEQDVEEARLVLERLPELGISLDQVTRQLEDDAVAKFNKPFDQLMETLAKACTNAKRVPADPRGRATSLEISTRAVNTVTEDSACWPRTDTIVDEHVRARGKAMQLSPLAGMPADRSMLVNVPGLVTAYYTEMPDPSVPAQRVAFGTSGHRGSAFDKAFNERHILAITQAICLYRAQQQIDGPLFLGMDTHALSVPACASALEVLAANGVDVMLAEHDEYTPTPAVSHAILAYNRGRDKGPADGIVVTPSHNPPDSGGVKYNPPNGGPADLDVTGWIEARANAFLESGLRGVKRIPFEKAVGASTTHRHNYLTAYVSDLAGAIDMEAIRGANISMGVDPLGGAGVHYWAAIAERYGVNLTVVNEEVDPTFRFMTTDWDGRIRMDPSSPYAMQQVIGLKDRFDIAFACDTDHDRHGIVTRSAGLLPPNHYLSVAIHYLFQHRPKWQPHAAVGKTVVSSRMIDRVTAALSRRLYEVPVGFKWFVDGLLDGSLGFGGEESAGASFLRRDGAAWTTDKDGIVSALLSAEITARMGRDPGEIYRELTREFGEPVYRRVDAPATTDEKERLKRLSPQQVRSKDFAGETIQTILTHAPGNGAPIGGLKVSTESGWFAARPSGTEDIYKMYAESFRGADHLRRILEEARSLVSEALAAAPERDKSMERMHS